MSIIAKWEIFIAHAQGLTLTFQLTSLVASDNLDVTDQKLFLLAKRCGWLPYYMNCS